MIAVGLLILCVGAWFASEPIRESKASQFDRDVASALSQKNYALAASRAHYASVLRSSSERKLTEAATSFLNEDYKTSSKQFSNIPGNVGAIGQLAAETRGKMRISSLDANSLTGEERVVASALALDRGDVEELRTMLTGLAIENDTIAVLAASATMVDDPSRAAAVLAASPGGITRISSNMPAFATMLNSILEQSGESMKAYSARSADAQRSNSEPSRYLFLTDALYRSGKYYSAVAMSEKTMSLAPNSRDAYVAQALGLAALGNQKAAKRSIETALEIDPSYGYAWFIKGRILEALGDTKGSATSQQNSERFLYTPAPEPTI